MTVLKIDYYGRVFMPVVKLEFVYAQEACLLLWRNQRFSVNRVKVFQPFQVDGFYDVLVKPGDFRDFLVRKSEGKQFPCIRFKLCRNKMLFCLEGNQLVSRRMAVLTVISVLDKAEFCQCVPERYVPQTPCLS